MRPELAISARNEARKARDSAHLPRLAPVLTARGMGAYRGYAELLDAHLYLADQGYELEVLGKSVQGQPLLALRLGPEPRGTLTRTSVVLAGVHPNEWIGVETALALCDQMLPGLPRDRSLLVVPIVNPDGLRRVEANLRAGRHRFVRHNAHGVDLNRNFASGWGRTGLLQRLLRVVFSPGPRAESEPEVQSLAHFLAHCRIDRAVSLHSFGAAVLFPSAYTTAPIADVVEHRLWASRVAQAASDKPYRAESCARWAKGITAGGLELDWFHDRHAAVSLLVECSRGGIGWSPRTWIEPFAWFNPRRVSAESSVIAQALVPYVSGAPPLG